MITAKKITAQPESSRRLIVSCKIIAPEITANTDSRHRINDAAVGSASFCATICKV